MIVYPTKVERIAQEIQTNEQSIINNINQEPISVYEYLQKEFSKKEANITSNYVFQFIFRSYYRLDNAGLTDDFKKKYFELIGGKEQDLTKILSVLYEFKTLRKRNTIQFSFATKLLHTINDNNPIVDSLVSKLTGLKTSGNTKKEKIESCVKSYEKLKQITKELLKRQEIQQVIKRFKEKFNTNISDIKALDFLLWSLGSIKKKG